MVVGLAAAVAGGRVVSGFLFGLNPTDPLIFSGVIVIVFAVAIAASLSPARRGAAADPMTSLRAE